MLASALTIAEKDLLQKFPRNISRENLICYFTLTKKDLRIIPARNHEYNRLGFAMQLCSLRFLGFFPQTTQEIPKNVLNFLASQLNLRFETLTYYGDKKTTKLVHQKIITRYLGFKRYNSSHKKALYKWLIERAMEHETTFHLVKLANEKLYIKKIIKPKVSTIERVVSSAKKQSWKQTYKIIFPVIKNEKKLLTSLLDEGDKNLSWLKATISQNSSGEILNTIEKIEYLKNLKVHCWNFSEINPNRVKYLYQQGKKTPKGDLKKFHLNKKYSILSIFLKNSFEELTDILIEQFDRNLQEKNSRAKNQLDIFRKKVAKSNNKITHWYKEIISIITDDNNDTYSLRDLIYSKVLPKELLIATIDDCKKILRPHDDHAIDFFAKSYSDIRKYSPRLLALLKLKSNISNNIILKKIKYLNKNNKDPNQIILNAAPISGIDNHWKKYIFDENGNINKRYYEMHTLWEFRSALRSGDIWTKNSRKFSNPESYLVPKKKWLSLKKEFLSMVGLNNNFKTHLNKKKKELEDLYPIVDKIIQNNKNIGEVRVEKNKLIIPRQRAIEPEDNELSKVIGNALPKVELASLILEVDGWTKFSKSFEHGSGGEPKNKEVIKNIYASIVSLACNLGHSQMAQASSIARSFLDWTTNWYLRDETLKEAMKKIINYQHRLPLSSHLGSGTLSSSDGQRFPTSVNSRNATKNPKYFAYGKGITHYSWTSDQFSQYGIKVISSSMRDATYILDEILANITELDILEHTSDTAGYTELIFALFSLLGIKFCPRIRDLGSQTLYRFGSRPTEYKNISPLLNGRINEEKIFNNSEELLRVAGSLKMGWSTASLVIQKLQAQTKDSRIAASLKEYGRIEKTIHILKYISEPQYQRKIGKQLNKGEALHALRKFLFFDNESKIRIPDSDDQQLQAQCLNLVTNMVITWNTVYMWRAIQELKKEGYLITDEDLLHLSPCRFEHINKLGRFNFEASKRLRMRSLRPFK